MEQTGSETAGDLPLPLALKQELLDHIGEGCQVIGPDWRYLYINEAAARQGKSTKEALLGRTMMEAYPGIDQTPMFKLLRTCMVERVQQSMINEFEFPDGSKGWFEIKFEPVPSGVFILTSDITKRHETEQKLRRSQREYRELITHLDGVVFSLDSGGKFIFVSDVIAEFGYAPEDLLGKHFSILVSDSDREPLETSFRQKSTGKSRGIREFRLVSKDGTQRQVKCQWRTKAGPDRRLGMTGILYDVTEMRKVEEQLRLTQKMESVGLLAGGIAHDFNNLLSVILSYSSFAMDALKPGDKIRKDIEQIEKAGLRAAALTRQLLTFSRRQVVKPELLNLNDVLKGFQPMLRRVISEDIDLKFKFGKGLGKVRADAGQLEQVVMNLVINARDALPSGGKIEVSTSNIEIDQDYANLHLEINPGAHVMLSVSDNGTGMSKEVKERVFEPFFTTKEPGKGTGLGLASVFGIVRQAEGNVFVYSEPGQGTTFKIFLPLADRNVVGEAPAKNHLRLKSGSGTVLIVEDEAPVREAAERILERAGYQVHSAPDGLTALEFLGRSGLEIDLLLTDVVMPGMSGSELASKAAQIRPGIRVLFMSGYADDDLIQRGAIEGTATVVSKPFSAASLSSQVEAMLKGEQ